MVNILFISNHTKINSVLRVLQPLLKIKIDSVGDFDYGLKDVFEKRPTLVFIQDQIAGVTGESVARHIQMLLGTGAPSFAFLHDGSLKAKPVKGLYEYLIDLSQAEEKVVEDIQTTLKSLLGAEWHKIYLSPAAKKLDSIEALERTEAHRVVADKLVDDFITDLEQTAPTPHALSPEQDAIILPDADQEEPFRFITSPQDQLKEMLSETTRQETVSESALPARISSSGQDASVVRSAERGQSGRQTAQEHQPGTAAPSHLHTAGATQEFPRPVKPSYQPSVRPTDLSAEMKNTPVIASSTVKAPPAPSSPADYKITRESRLSGTDSENLLQDFEDKLRSKSSTGKRYLFIALVLIVCASGAGWYIVQQKPHLLFFKDKSTAVVAPVPAAKLQEPVPQKPVQCPLPSFVPLAGRDRTFVSKEPGWERYVGAAYECRVFCKAGTLKAVQIIAVKGKEIQESMLKDVLKELTGNGDFHVISQENKLGLLVVHATVDQKADLLVYRNKSVIQAVVVALN